MFGSGNNAGSITPKLSAIAIQSMGYGVPIQVCYGSNRVSPTLGWTRDFKSVQHQSSSGGKGGGGGGSISYTYSASVILFVCEGTIRGYGQMWRDKNIYPALSGAVGISALTPGSLAQAPWSYLSASYPAEAIRYPGVSYVSASNYTLSDGATLGNHSFEIFGRCLSATITDQNYTDAHIADIIADFIGNTIYGAVDANSATITTDTASLHSYCRARGLLISPLLSSKKPAHEYLTEWATIANCGIVWSEGKLKFIPYADTAYSNSFGTYAPVTTIRYAFNDDSIAEPVQPKRKKPIDCYNKITIEHLNRSKSYNKTITDVSDQAAVEQYGLRPADNLVFDSITLTRVAKIVAHTQLLRGLYIRNEYTIQGWCDADLLEPLDFITITDAGIGMNAARCRIISIADEQDGRLTIIAEEAPAGVYSG
jgi:hypothetical protein